MTQEDKEKYFLEILIKRITEKIAEDTVDIPSEIQEIIDENFFELL